MQRAKDCSKRKCAKAPIDAESIDWGLPLCFFAKPAVLPLVAAKESTDAQQHRRRKGAVIRRQRGMPRMLRQKALYARAVHQDIDQQPLASIFQRPQQRGPGGDQRHSQRQLGASFGA